MQRLHLHALVAELLATLEADGQPFGTGAHLRIGELLQNLPENTAPEHLKTLLAPVLCTTKEEQERFYQIFERSWKQVKDVGVLEDITPNILENEIQTKRSNPKALEILWYVGVSLMIIVIFILLRQINGLERNKPNREEITVRVGESGRYGITLGSPDVIFKNECPPLDTANIKIRWDSVGKSITYSKDHIRFYNSQIYYTALKEGVDSFCLQIKPDEGSARRRRIIVFNVIDTLDVPPSESKDTALYVQRPIPHPRDLTQLEAPQPTALQLFLLDWEWPLKVAAMLLAGLLVWFAARLWERNRRKLIAEHRPNQKPPYTWSIQLKNPPRVDLGERFQRLLSQLRRREADENWRLDVPRTLRATIARGGVPQFRYAQQTRPSEYLLLIDRHSPRNHQAQLFDLMFRGFRNQEVLLERFWYDGDPRLCWNEAFPAGLDPRALHYHYPQSRVIIFGDAEQLLNQQTGRLSKWATQTFSAWQDRAVLSPRPLNAWGRREHALQELFHVLPVSLSTLEVAIERFETDVEKDAELDPRRFPDAAQVPIQLIDNDLIKTLEHYFNSDQSTNHLSPVNQLPTWIAACAVYPELHWDMTLYLGDLLSDSNTQLLTADNIAQISRLPWFSEGEIPLEARKTLLAWLEREQPDTLHTIREGIHRLLAQNPPPEDSAAHDAYAMNMALNEWLYTKDSDRKKELEKDILRRIAAGQAADFMVLKILEGPRSPEEFEVPENWRKHLKQKGLTKTTRKSWVWAVPLWVLLCVGVVGWKPDEVGCKGVAMTYSEKEWCAETLEEVLQVWEMQTLKIVTNDDSSKFKNLANSVVGDVLKIGRETRWSNYQVNNLVHPKDIQNLSWLLIGKNPIGTIDSISFLQNLVVGYFNQGVTLRDSMVQRDTFSCRYFLRAQELNVLLPDTLQYWFVRAAARNCNRIPTDIGSKQKQVSDWVLKGELRDGATKALITGIPPSQIIITAKGLPYGYMLGGSHFRLGMPSNWNSPVIATAIVPGFDTAIATMLPNDFNNKKPLTFYLNRTKPPSVADRDNDGVPDKEDACPDEFGDKINKGCPESKIAIADRDGDGVPDSEDSCPDVKGTIYGCPPGTLFREHRVTQGETLRSIAAKYKLEIGALAQANGVEVRETLAVGKILLIPIVKEVDRDGDGVPDSEDECPDEKGKFKGGCPDYGGFRVFDNLEQLQDRISQIKSDVIILYFWATWDPICVQELPFFDTLGIEYPSNRVHVLLVSMDFKNQLEKRFIPFLKKQNIKSEVGLMADLDLDTSIPYLDETWDGTIPFTLLLKENGQRKRIGKLGKFENYGELKKFVDDFLNSKK